MSADLMADPRVRSVAWRDLVALTPLEVVWELTLPLPWLLAGLALAAMGWWPLAVASAFAFFLCGLRVVHNAYHYALGVPRWATEGVMALLGALMLLSMHAVQFNHLRHHRHCLEPEDIEAVSARMPAWRALAMGPWFPILLHVTAWRLGDRRTRAWVVTELALSGLVLAFVYWLAWAPLAWHFGAMAVGQCLTAFFAVWTVHHDVDPRAQIARTLRGRWKNLVSYSMFRHVEHHLFPAVPTCHLRQLSDRLDRVAPEAAAAQVF